MPEIELGLAMCKEMPYPLFYLSLWFLLLQFLFVLGHQDQEFHTYKANAASLSLHPCFLSSPPFKIFFFMVFGPCLARQMPCSLFYLSGPSSATFLTGLSFSGCRVPLCYPLPVSGIDTSTVPPATNSTQDTRGSWPTACLTRYLLLCLSPMQTSMEVI